MDGMAAALEIRAAEQAESERRITNSLREKEIMLKEIHHRVKNNLQLVVSLISLQRREPVAMDVFAAKLDGRVRAMALVYEVLYRSEDFASVDVPAYAEELSALIIQNAQPRGGCDFSFNATPLRLPLDTVIPFGLILNELLCNACSHAVCFDERCRVAVDIVHENDRVRVSVSDNGAGVSNKHQFEEGLGMRLIRSLAAQLRGSIEWKNNGGILVVLDFPVSQPKAELGFYHRSGKGEL
jgi:two-component sensor histidine kinase